MLLLITLICDSSSNDLLNRRYNICVNNELKMLEIIICFLATKSRRGAESHRDIQVGLTYKLFGMENWKPLITKEQLISISTLEDIILLEK